MYTVLQRGGSALPGRRRRAVGRYNYPDDNCFCPDDIDPDILESLITMIQAMFTLVAIHSAIMDGTSQMQQLFAGN